MEDPYNLSALLQSCKQILWEMCLKTPDFPTRPLDSRADISGDCYQRKTDPLEKEIKCKYISQKEPHKFQENSSVPVLRGVVNKFPDWLLKTQKGLP